MMRLERCVSLFGYFLRMVLCDFKMRFRMVLVFFGSQSGTSDKTVVSSFSFFCICFLNRVRVM